MKTRKTRRLEALRYSRLETCATPPRGREIFVEKEKGVIPATRSAGPHYVSQNLRFDDGVVGRNKPDLSAGECGVKSVRPHAMASRVAMPPGQRRYRYLTAAPFALPAG